MAGAAAARLLLREIDDILRHRPAVGAVNAETRSIYRKFGVSSRNDAVQKAAALGLLGA
jgi:ATP/maltotriose-dependent transcriptional regulator MalT